MEWNTKWDLENLDIFNSKPSQISSKKIQTFTDWEMEEADADNASFNLSGGCPAIASASASASDVDHISSAKSSVCTDGSSKEGYNKAPEFALTPVDGFSRYFSKAGADLTRTSQSLETSAGSGGEPLMGLKLGKRTYFENNSGVNYAKTSSVSVIPSSSASTLKKSKPPNVNATRCQVEGCNLDLSSAKEYHRKHRVCESHSKCPKVIIGGLQRRFCQQCSRFHSLSEFDEKKRSCRRRLSDHNARRRKPQQETIQFNSSGLSSSHYGTQQMSFVLNNPPPQSRAAGNSGWGDTYRSNFAVAKGYPKPEKAGIVDRQHTHFPGVLPSHVMLNHGSSKLLQYKGVNEAFSQGSKGSMLSSNLDETTPELHRALSLLSNTSWGSCEPGSVTLDHSSNVKGTNMPQYMMHAVPRGLPLASSECWQTEVQSTDAHMHSLTANSSSGNYYQEIQQFTPPYESGFHSDLFS